MFYLFLVKVKDFKFEHSKNQTKDWYRTVEGATSPLTIEVSRQIKV